jgi:hypothetical protein
MGRFLNLIRDVFTFPLGQLPPDDLQLLETSFFNGTIPVALVVLGSHLYFSRRPRNNWFFTTDIAFVVFVVALLSALVLALQGGKYTIRFTDVAGFVVLFGAVVFVSLSEIFLRGLAEFLTRQRGDKWVKELDYIYLFFAAIGLLASINRLDTIHDHIVVPDFYGPMLVAAALAIRAIKTRADIAGWNKLPLVQPSV